MTSRRGPINLGLAGTIYHGVFHSIRDAVLGFAHHVTWPGSRGNSNAGHQQVANYYQVSAGQTSVGITLNYGDYEDVSAGGTTIETTVNAGAQLAVYSGGTASSTTVAGSIGFFGDGGDAISTVVLSGAQFQVGYGGSASYTLVSGG